MARTPTRLAGPALVTGSAATKVTAAAGTKVVVRHIRVSNPAGGTNRTFTLSIGADAAGTRIIAAETIPTGEAREWFGPWTLEAAEVIQALASQTNELTLTIDGDVYTLG